MIKVFHTKVILANHTILPKILFHTWTQNPAWPPWPWPCLQFHLAIDPVTFGHKSGHKWPKSDKSGHSWSFGHAYNTLTITCLRICLPYILRTKFGWMNTSYCVYHWTIKWHVSTNFSTFPPLVEAMSRTAPYDNITTPKVAGAGWWWSVPSSATVLLLVYFCQVSRHVS